MQSLIDGISWGLFLSILIGPIFFALIQAGIEQGFRAGLMVGFGIWVSDLIFVGISFWGISSVVKITKWDGFQTWVGLVGGIILILFGLGTLFTRPPEILKKKDPEKDYPLNYKTASYISLWLKGFLVNTVNPFTLLFWVGLISTIAVKPNFDNTQAVQFAIGILGTIVVTDSIKVGLAKAIRRWLKPAHVLWMRWISGAAFFVFGVVMIVRVLLWTSG